MDFNNGKIPPCMIGTWAWGTGMNGSRLVFGKSYSEEQLAQTFDTAYHAGFRFWDTAEVYGMGNAERMLKKCIEDKSDIFISTKHQPKKIYQKGEVIKEAGNK